MASLNLRAAQQFTAFYLVVQCTPNCEDSSLLPNNAENVTPGAPTPSRAWLVNCLDAACLKKGSVFSGSITIGRRPISDIVLKDRAISTKHAALNWELEIVRCASTDVWSRPVATNEPCFGRGDSICLRVTITDNSTNGSFEGDMRLARNTAVPIVPRLLSESGKAVFLPFDSIGATPSECISLGKARVLHDDSRAGIRPVFSFGLGVLASPPWHQPIKKLSPIMLKVFPFSLDPSLIKLLVPRPQPTSEPRKVKSEPIQNESAVSVTRLTNTHDRNPVDLTTESPAPPARYSNDFAPLPAEVASLRERLRSADAQLRDRLKEVEELKASNVKYKNELASAQKALQESAARQADLEAAASESTRRTDTRQREVEQKVAELQVEAGLHQRKIATLQSQLTQCQKERDEKAQENQCLTEELERSDVKRTQAVGQLEESNERLRLVEAERRDLQSEVNRLKAEAGASSVTANRLEADLKELREKVTALEIRCQTSQDTLSESKVQLAQLQNVNIQLMNDKTALSRQLESKRRLLHAKETALRHTGKVTQGAVQELRLTLSHLMQQISQIDSLSASEPMSDQPYGSETLSGREWGAARDMDEEGDPPTDDEAKQDEASHDSSSQGMDFNVPATLDAPEDSGLVETDREDKDEVSSSPSSDRSDATDTEGAVSDKRKLSGEAEAVFGKRRRILDSTGMSPERESSLLRELFAGAELSVNASPTQEDDTPHQ